VTYSRRDNTLFFPFLPASYWLQILPILCNCFSFTIQSCLCLLYYSLITSTRRTICGRDEKELVQQQKKLSSRYLPLRPTAETIFPSSNCFDSPSPTTHTRIQTSPILGTIEMECTTCHGATHSALFTHHHPVRVP
jgi:hypothetical protein